MKALTANIQIGNFQFYQVESIQIERSWKFLSDRARIGLPKRLVTRGDLGGVAVEDFSTVFKLGDPVSIQLGYDFNFKTEFEGFVSAIQPDLPFVVECEDVMWKLRQTKHNESWRSATLREVLTAILPIDIPFKLTGEVQLGKFRISEVSAYQVLEKIKEVYGLVSYWRNGQVVVGFPYGEQGARVNLSFQKNILPNSDLKYRRVDDLKIQVKAISIQEDGTKIEETIGDEDGELHSLHLPSGLNAQQLREQAEEKMKLFRFNGYQGNITTFGEPYVQHGDIVELFDAMQPERNGAYRIDAQNVSFGSGGYRRVLELGALVE